MSPTFPSDSPIGRIEFDIEPVLERTWAETVVSFDEYTPSAHIERACYGNARSVLKSFGGMVDDLAERLDETAHCDRWGAAEALQRWEQAFQAAIMRLRELRQKWE